MSHPTPPSSSLEPPWLNDPETKNGAADGGDGKADPSVLAAFQDYIKLMPLVAEANQMSEELKKGLNMELKVKNLASSDSKGYDLQKEVLVKVTHHGTHEVLQKRPFHQLHWLIHWTLLSGRSVLETEDPASSPSASEEETENAGPSCSAPCAHQAPGAALRLRAPAHSAVALPGCSLPAQQLELHFSAPLLIARKLPKCSGPRLIFVKLLKIVK
nr:uncharacterized protein LOC112427831 [Macaca nemestrina]